MSFSGLDTPCAACGRPSGDHTLREWAVCMGKSTTDVPYAAVPDDMVAVASVAIRERFQLDSDSIVADHVVIRAATLSGSAGAVGLKIPALLHEFQLGIPDKPPVMLAKVMFIADIAGMRAYGRLVRDSANGAANASGGSTE